MKTFNNFLFKKHFFVYTLITLMTFFHQNVMAQGNTRDTITIGNIEVSTEDLNSDFYLVSLIGDIDIVEYASDSFRVMSTYYQYAEPFLAAGMPVEGLHRFRVTPLIYAIVYEDTEAIEYMVGEADVDFSMPDSNGTTPFLWAVVVGNKNILRHLVDAGINFHEDKDIAIEYLETKGNQTIIDYIRGLD